MEELVTNVTNCEDVAVLEEEADQLDGQLVKVLVEKGCDTKEDTGGEETAENLEQVLKTEFG